MFMRLPPRRVTLLILCLHVVLFLYVYLVIFGAYPSEEILSHPYFFYDLDSKEPREPEQNCNLPRLHPFHPSIWAYLKFQKDITCRKRQPELFYIDDRGKVTFNKSELTSSGYEPGKSLFCQWQQVLRDGDDHVSYGKEVPISKDGYQLTENISIIRIRCQNFAGIGIYEKVQAHIHLPQSNRPSASSQDRPVNVLIFGLDSLSRLAFIRHLPRTYRYLTEVLNMTVLRGMDKVGDNTFPNLIPILTGHKAYGDGLGSASDFFDHWPLIWKNFTAAGYKTLWAEDFIEYGLFNYLAKGFHQPPTDHYMRPYWLAIEGSSTLRSSSYMCYGSKPKYFVQMDFLRRFVSAYEESRTPYFGFSFLAEVSHEYTTRISSADAHFQEFFTWLKDRLDNTFLIVMSDHGHRFDSIRTTQVGHIEERMPFYAIRLPQSVISRQPLALEALKQNSGRLVTPFDIYATLADILQLSTSSRPLGLRNSSWERLGQTLFRNVPLNRTCASASIPIQYCICQTDTAINTNEPRAQRAAAASVTAINRLVEEGGLAAACRARTLKKIRSAHAVHTAEEPEDDFKVRVMFDTEPAGMFEALVDVRTDSATLVGEVSRIDPYRNQSGCIKHIILRKFCYCHQPHLTPVSAKNDSLQSTS